MNLLYTAYARYTTTRLGRWPNRRSLYAGGTVLYYIMYYYYIIEQTDNFSSIICSDCFIELRIIIFMIFIPLHNSYSYYISIVNPWINPRPALLQILPRWERSAQGWKVQGQMVKVHGTFSAWYREHGVQDCLPRLQVCIVPAPYYIIALRNIWV